MSKPKKIEEISIDLTKHDIEIKSYAGSYVELKVDGIKIPNRSTKFHSLNRIEFIAPFLNGVEDINKKMLQVIVGY